MVFGSEVAGCQGGADGRGDYGSIGGENGGANTEMEYRLQ